MESKQEYKRKILKNFRMSRFLSFAQVILFLCFALPMITFVLDHSLRLPPVIGYSIPGFLVAWLVAFEISKYLSRSSIKKWKIETDQMEISRTEALKQLISELRNSTLKS